MTPRTWFFSLIGACVQVGLYLIFTNNTGWRELIAAGVVGVIAMVATLVFQFASHVKFRFNWRDVVQAWHLPWDVMKDTWLVLTSVVQHLFTRHAFEGQLAAVEFDAGAKNDLFDAGRRALAITYTTATPNTVILGIVDDQQYLLYHQMMPDRLSKMTCNLGARP